MPAPQTTAAKSNQSSRRAENRPLIPFLICCGLIALTLAAFWPVSKCGFINFDDPDYVTENAHVQAGITWATIKWAFTTTEASNWHPITWLSHALDWQLFRGNAAGHHLVSLGIHIANALLVFWVFRSLTGALWRSAILAALFAVHPAHVESVAWISERKDVLSAFFFLLTLLAYGRYARTTRPQDHRQQDDRPKSEAERSVDLKGSKTNLPKAYPEQIPQGSGVRRPSAAFMWYALAMVFFAFGLMSKPMLVTLPFVLLLLDFWPLKRLRTTERGPRAALETGVRKALSVQEMTPGNAARTWLSAFPTLLLEKIPFFLFSALSCAITVRAQSHGGAVKDALPLLLRLENAAVAYMRYLGLAFWPAKVSNFYPHPGMWAIAVVVICTVVMILLSALAVGFRHRFPYAFVGWFWFVGMLVPVIGLVQVGSQSIADRYTYISFIGVFLVLVWANADLLIRMRSTRAAARCAGWLGTLTASALLICAFIARKDVRYWHDSGTLFTHAINVTRNNYVAHEHLGIFLADTGHRSEAIEEYEKCLRINPEFGETHNNFGVELVRAGKIEDAEIHFRRAVELSPMMGEAHNNLGLLLTASGRSSEAIPEFRAALRVKDDGRFHLNLARAYCMTGIFPEGVAEYRAAMRGGATDVQIRIELAGALGEVGKRDEARRLCEEVLKLSPGYKPAEALLKALDARP